MVLLLRKLYLYFAKDPEAVHYFPGRGGVVSNFFQWRVQMLISIETHIRTCYFPGGVRTPSPSGSAHGQCHHNRTIFTIFFTVRLLTIIVRH